MAGEAILIFENDPAFERQLNAVLSAAGYEVYAGDSATSVLQALETTRFPMVIVDARAPGIDPAGFALRALELQPDCAVVFTGAGCTTGEAVSMLRGGAADFLAKPFEAGLLKQRVDVALQRRRSARARVQLWERRAHAAEQALGEQSGKPSIPPNRIEEIRDFAEYALEKFLRLERRNMKLERDLRRLESPGSVQERPALITWVAHSDTEFAHGVLSLGPQLNLDVRPPMQTGGEVLDKVSSTLPNIVVLDSSLPDIPTTLVVETLKSQHPDIQIATVSGWGTPERTITLTGGSAPDVTRAMETVEDLIETLEVAAERADDTLVGRDFAAEFKNRHDDFLRRYAELRSAVDAL